MKLLLGALVFYATTGGSIATAGDADRKGQRPKRSRTLFKVSNVWQEEVADTIEINAFDYERFLGVGSMSMESTTPDDKPSDSSVSKPQPAVPSPEGTAAAPSSASEPQPNAPSPEDTTAPVAPSSSSFAMGSQPTDDDTMDSPSNATIPKGTVGNETSDSANVTSSLAPTDINGTYAPTSSTSIGNETSDSTNATSTINGTEAPSSATTSYTTFLPTDTYAPTNTNAPTNTHAPTNTFSPTATWAPTETFAPTETYSPTTMPVPVPSASANRTYRFSLSVCIFLAMHIVL